MVNSGAGTVSVIDTASASVVATVTVGANPVAIAVDSTRHLAYVVNKAANSVSILDETTNTVTGTLPVGQGPIAVVVDTGTNTIFVADANGEQGNISRINGATRVVTPTEALGRCRSGSPSTPQVTPSTSTRSSQLPRRASAPSLRSWTKRPSSRRAPQG